MTGAGIEPATFRLSAGLVAYSNVFQLVMLGQSGELGDLEHLAQRFGPILAP